MPKSSNRTEFRLFIQGTRLTSLTELQVKSLFYPCDNLALQATLGDDVALELVPRWLYIADVEGHLDLTPNCTIGLHGPSLGLVERLSAWARSGPLKMCILRLITQPAEADSEAMANSQIHPETVVPLPFPPRTISARKPDSDNELLKMFRKVEINIPLLDAIKQIPKYAKFLKELCVHKRRKMEGSRKLGGVVSTLTKTNSTIGISQVLPKKCRDPGIFSVPCTIGDCTFADAMLDLGASINVMLASTYRSLNFKDLEPTGMTIQLANSSIMQPLGVLKDVLVQVNELIFPADFYVLDMEDEISGKGSTLIHGRPFLMTARTKIDLHAGTLSMEFGDTLVQFNIFEAMKHPTEDHSLFGVDIMEELVDEKVEDYARLTKSISCLQTDYDEIQEFPDSEGDHSDVIDLAFEQELMELINQICYPKTSENTNNAEVTVGEKPLPAQLATIFTAEMKSAKEGRVNARIKSEAAHEVKVDLNSTRPETILSRRSKQHRAEIMSALMMLSREQAGQTDPKHIIKESPSIPPMELKLLPNHLKYAYLDSEQQLPVIITNNLLPEQEDKLLKVLRQHKKAIGWKLSDLPGINPSICMHRILMEEDIKPIRQQQRRLNPTILDVVKKEVTKLLAAGIIYPISDSQWVSPVQVVPKKSGMT
ncbi:hypothetical protein CR513_37128, partial [Mucuna pruriens]